jgi:hypothetical protein
MSENKNKKIKKTKSPKKPRAMTLAIAEPRLRASGRNGAADVAERETRTKASAPAALPQKAGGQIHELRASGRNGAADVAERETRTEANALVALPQKAGGQIYEMMFSWSPWRSAMLPQQAFVAYLFSNLMRAQQQFAQIWRSPGR